MTRHALPPDNPSSRPPDPIRRQFESDHRNLLTSLRQEFQRGFDPALLDRAIENAAETFPRLDREATRISDWDVLRAPAIYGLAKVRYAAGLNKTEGLRVLAGDTAAAFSAGGSTKKGKSYEPKASIRKICKRIGRTDLDAVLTFLRDAEECANLFGSTVDPIDANFLGFDPPATAYEDDDDDNYDEFGDRITPPIRPKTVLWVRRGENAESPRRLTLGRLNNILGEIRKEKL